MNHHHHHHRRNIQIRIPVQGVPIELTPMDQFKTIFSIDNINFSIVENNKLLKANIDTFGSQALFIRKTKPSFTYRIFTYFHTNNKYFLFCFTKA